MAKKSGKKGSRTKQRPIQQNQVTTQATADKQPVEEKPKPVPVEPKAKPKDTKVKRGIAAAVEVPSMIVPFLVWVVVYFITHFLAKYDTRVFGVDLDRQLMLVAGGVTLIFFVVVPVYRNRAQLTKGFAKGIIYGGMGLALLVFGFSVYTAADWGPAVASGTVKAGTELVNVNLPDTRYTLFVRGSFPEMDSEQQKLEDQEAAAKKAKAEGKETKKVRRTGTYKVSGPYELRLVTSQNLDVVDSFKGTFEQERQRRRLSKKSRGYLDVIHTTKLFPLRVDKPGDYKFQLALMGGDLSQDIEFAIYHDRQFPVIIGLIGAVLAFFFGFIDTLIKPLRVDSYFAPAIGIAAGFTAYFTSTAIPEADFSAMGVSLMVGAVMGGGSSYALYLISTKPYTAIARKFMWTLN